MGHPVFSMELKRDSIAHARLPFKVEITEGVIVRTIVHTISLIHNLIKIKKYLIDTKSYPPSALHRSKIMF